MKTSAAPILFVITGLAPGGAETQLVRVATRLARRGWPICVLSLMPPVWGVDRLRAYGIRVLTADVRSKSHGWRAVRAFFKAVHQCQPRIVHGYLFHANVLVRLARLFAPKSKIVCSVRSIHEGGRWRIWAYRLTRRWCDLMTHVSLEGVAKYSHLGVMPPEKLRYVPNGVDLISYAPSPQMRLKLRTQLQVKEHHFAWLAAGRLVKAKDYPNLLRAFVRVVVLAPNARLWIAGDGPLAPELRALAHQLGLYEHIRFLGFRQDLPALYQAADAFVLSSAWEGMPNVVLEAAASGLPLVATRVSGVGALVLDGQTGFLVPPRDASALAQAMIRLMHLSPTERKAMGARARTHVETHFALDRIVERWEAIYHALLQDAH